MTQQAPIIRISSSNINSLVNQPIVLNKKNPNELHFQIESIIPKKWSQQNINYKVINVFKINPIAHGLFKAAYTI